LEPELRALQKALAGDLCDPSPVYRVMDTTLIPAIRYILEKGKAGQMLRVTHITAPGEPKLIRTVLGGGYALKGA
jgi:hypothetical protein